MALIVLLGPQRPLTLEIIELDDKISALDLNEQRKFIDDDLRRPRIIRQEGAGRETYTLVGNRLRYVTTEFLRDESSPRGTWDLAYCGNSTELRYSSGDGDQGDLGPVPIRVFTLRALALDENVVRKTATSWKSYLPRATSNSLERDNLQRIHDFFNITNQIELLMRDAEIFAYVIVERRFVEGAEEVSVREVPRKRVVPPFAQMFEGMVEFLQQEEDARDGNLVYLGDEDTLELGREVPPPEFWNVTEVNVDSRVVTLRRPDRTGQTPPPVQGHLRAWGLFGQMSLIKRRKRAIDRLGGHAYMLRALQSPDFTFVDTGETLPREIDPLRLIRQNVLQCRVFGERGRYLLYRGHPVRGKQLSSPIYWRRCLKTILLLKCW